MIGKKPAFLMLALLLVGTVVLAGCTQPDDGYDGPRRGFGNRTFNGTRGGAGVGSGGFGNLTESQRQDRAQQRRFALTTACDGKAENDACTLEGRDNRNGSNTNLTLNGTCHALNGTMRCWPQFQDRGGFGRPEGRG
ncbi:hypothetical protein HY994_05535 [Candidatus Micrarchaeota archaeon]|nr:hypothetical protein [Candidatus Micrarchaeota archaeon]